MESGSAGLRASFASVRSGLGAGVGDPLRMSFDRSESHASIRPMSAYQPLEDGPHRSLVSSAVFSGPRLSVSAEGPTFTFKSADLRRALELHEALARKAYMEGYLLVRHALGVDGQPDHRTHRFDTWTECFVQLHGTVLSLWEAQRLADAAQQGRDVPPMYINVTEALVDYIGMYVDAPLSDPGTRRTLYHVFALNSAGQNRVLFCFHIPPPCDPAKVEQRLSPKNAQHPEHAAVVEWRNIGLQYLQAWINAIRLASWERMRLDEIYTGALIRARLSAVKGADVADISELAVRSPLVKGRHEGFVRARFMGSTEWRRCWMVVQSHWSDGEQATGLRRMFRLGGDRASVVAESTHPPPPPPGVIPSPAVAYLYDSRRSKQPFASLWHVRHVYAVYPSRAQLVEDSVLFKAEGSLPHTSSTSATLHPRTSGWVMFMPDMPAGQARGANAEMMKWIIAMMDAFGLYGRPDQFAWDPRSAHSPFFAYPIGPFKDHLFLDRALAECLDISVEDHMVTRQMLHDIMAARMRGEQTAIAPPLPAILSQSASQPAPAPTAPADALLTPRAQGMPLSNETPKEAAPAPDARPASGEALPSAALAAGTSPTGASSYGALSSGVSSYDAAPASRADRDAAGAAPSAAADMAAPPKLKAAAFQARRLSMEPAVQAPAPHPTFDQAYREYDHAAAFDAGPSASLYDALPTLPPVSSEMDELDRTLQALTTEPDTQPINPRHDLIYPWPIPEQAEQTPLSPIAEASQAGAPPLSTQTQASVYAGTQSASTDAPGSSASTASPALPSTLSFLAPSVGACHVSSDTDHETEAHVVQDYIEEPKALPPVTSSVVTTSQPPPPRRAPMPSNDDDAYGMPDEQRSPPDAPRRRVLPIDDAGAYPSSFGRRQQQQQPSTAHAKHASVRPGRMPGAASQASHEWVDHDDEYDVPEAPADAPAADPNEFWISPATPASSHDASPMPPAPSMAPSQPLPTARAKASAPPRTTFVKLDDPRASRAHPTQGLLAAASQERLVRNARQQEAREAGQALVQVPHKPPPPQAGLMGAIHSRHTSAAPAEQPRPARPASAAAPSESSAPTPHGLWPQQQMMMNMYYWQQQQMMMMGMMPYMSRENMIAQQQAMQAAQQAYYQAYMQYAPSSAMPTPASSPGVPSMPMMPMMPMPMMDGSMPMMPTSSSSAGHGSAARDGSAPSQRSSTPWDAPKSKSPPPPIARTHRA